MDIISSLSLVQRARYLLTATFVTYNNSLHSYWNTESGTGSCCDGNDFPTNCTGPCNAVLMYCFRDYGTEDFTDDMGFINGCLEQTSSRLLKEPIDYIDYSMPPCTVFNKTTISVLKTDNDDPWPVS